MWKTFSKINVFFSKKKLYSKQLFKLLLDIEHWKISKFVLNSKNLNISTFLFVLNVDGGNFARKSINFNDKMLPGNENNQERLLRYLDKPEKKKIMYIFSLFWSKFLWVREGNWVVTFEFSKCNVCHFWPYGLFILSVYNTTTCKILPITSCEQ